MRRFTPGTIAMWDEQDELRKAEFHELLKQPTMTDQVLDAINTAVSPDDPDRMALVWKLGELVHLGWDVNDLTLIAKARFLLEYQRSRGIANIGHRAEFDTAPRKLGDVVYYIQIRDTIKIGFTTQDPERRCRTLAGDRVLAVEPGNMKLESERHHQFAAYRARIPGTRERFHPSDELMDHILEVRKIHADIQVG